MWPHAPWIGSETLAPEEKLAPWMMHQVEENMDKSQLSDEQDLVNSPGNEPDQSSAHCIYHILSL